MCFGMNCPYEGYDGECRVRGGRPRVYPPDAACVDRGTSGGDPGRPAEDEPQGVVETDPNTD